MTSLTDLKRVELALPAALLRSVMLGYAKDVEGQTAEERRLVRLLLGLLQQAGLEPLDGLTAKDKAKLIRRIDRAVNHALDEYAKHEAVILKVMLLVIYWVQARLDSGELVLMKDSAFDKAVSLLIAQLENWERLWAEVMDSALKQSRKMHERLMALGYYRG